MRMKREDLNASLAAHTEIACQCGSLGHAIVVIDEQIEKLLLRQQNSKEIDQGELMRQLYRLKHMAERLRDQREDPAPLK